MDVNYRYFVEYAASQGRTVLDYGCGQGQVVEALRQRGVECYGTDLFYASGVGRDDAQALIDRGWVRPFKTGEPLPFEDDSFDLIVSNQVFEHVADLPPVVRELDRVLKPEGKMLHHFPSKAVLREGHIGVPLSHRLPRGRARLAYTALVRRLGFGHGRLFDPDLPPREWAETALDWIDRYCYYRPYREIAAAFSGFEITHREAEYCQFRAGRKLPFPRLQSVALRSLAFMALELRR